jgi:hypothetical protein
MIEVAGKYHYSGAIHMHTTESDGTVTLEQLAAIGQESGLDYMMVTDHMNLNNRIAGKEGIYGKTLVVTGYEHNDTADIHHYLIFGSPSVYPHAMTPKEYVEAAAKDGALGIIAHPDEIRSRMRNYPPYPWKDWDAVGFNGIEIWNQMSEWMERLTPYNKLAMAFSPRKSMIAPTDRVRAKWDELSLAGKCVGIAAVDAHAFPIPVGPFVVRIFPYKVHFKSLRTTVILDEPFANDFATASTQLYDALRNCRAYCANLRWGDADGFDFWAHSDNARAGIGESIRLTPDLRLYAILPVRAKIVVVHNGETVHEVSGRELNMPVSQPGVYRIEAWRGSRGWIFSNHIRVGV